MTTRIVRNQVELDYLKIYLDSLKLPLTVNIKKGEDRTIEQNKLQRMWVREAEEQGDHTAEEYRGYCKLTFGCAILYHENEEFADAFDAVIRPLSYENKLKAMMLPLDMPVTRLMTVKQTTKYLDQVFEFFLELGMQLTEPKEK